MKKTGAKEKKKKSDKEEEYLSKIDPSKNVSEISFLAEQWAALKGSSGQGSSKGDDDIYLGSYECISSWDFSYSFKTETGAKRKKAVSKKAPMAKRARTEEGETAPTEVAKERRDKLRDEPIDTPFDQPKGPEVIHLDEEEEPGDAFGGEGQK